MNVKQAKEIPVEELLRRCGYEPAREHGETVWYKSPLREEATPSFKVNRARNLWIDFGDGRGGDVIDLARLLFGCPDVSETLKAIERTTGGAPAAPPRRPAPKPAPAEPAAELIDVGPVRSRALLHYLRKRGIDPAAVADAVREVRYRRGEREYFGLGFANDAGGYELRTATFKDTLGKKELTTLSGDPDRVAVFEGFFDYLTAMTLNGGPLEGSVIVLNSTALITRAIILLRRLSPSRIDLYRDNDAAGRELLATIRTLPNVKVIDHAADYATYADLNERHEAAADKRRHFPGCEKFGIE